MRVLIDLTSLADNFSGIERYAACLTIEMIKDYSIEWILVFKSEVHKLFESVSRLKNVEIVLLKGANKLFFNQIRLPNAIRKIKADYYLFLAFPVPIFLFKKNMISTIHDICCWDCPETMTVMSKWYFRISNRVAVKKCKRIITISQFSRNRIIEKLRVRPEKIWLIYCGVDGKFLHYVSSEIENKRIREKYNLPPKYLLSLSTLEPRKNLNLLIKTYSQLIKKEKYVIPLVLAGRKGWKMDSILSSIDQDAKNQILFTGFIDDDDLPVVYGNAALFIFPSKYEGFGMPPLEALACGTNVISSDSSSLPEVLGHDVVFFKNDDEESLLNCIKDFDITKKDGAFSQQVKKFTWKKESSNLIEKMRNNT